MSVRPLKIFKRTAKLRVLKTRKALKELKGPKVKKQATGFGTPSQPGIIAVRLKNQKNFHILFFAHSKKHGTPNKSYPDITILVDSE